MFRCQTTKMLSRLIFWWGGRNFCDRQMAQRSQQGLTNLRQLKSSVCIKCTVDNAHTSSGHDKDEICDLPGSDPVHLDRFGTVAGRSEFVAHVHICRCRFEHLFDRETARWVGQLKLQHLKLSMRTYSDIVCAQSRSARITDTIIKVQVLQAKDKNTQNGHHRSGFRSKSLEKKIRSQSGVSSGRKTYGSMPKGQWPRQILSASLQGLRAVQQCCLSW